MADETSSADGRILVVDDDAPLRHSVCRALQLHGYEVVEAADAREARRLLDVEGGQVAMVIMDVVLPGLEGDELANLLQAHHPHLKILYTSGHAPDVRRIRSLAPDRPFLQKPFDIPELLEAVKAVMPPSA